MAFAVRNLSVLAYANGFTLWHYKSGKDRLDTVCGGNYLADASDMLTVGDLVMITAADGARIVCVTLADVQTVITAPMAQKPAGEHVVQPSAGPAIRQGQVGLGSCRSWVRSVLGPLGRVSAALRPDAEAVPRP